MNVSLTLVVVMAVLYAAGVYLLMERSMTRVLLGFLLVGNATNLLIFIVAGRPGRAPIADGEVGARDVTDPLPQALILTAIVITFAVSAFLLALIYRSWRLSHGDEVTDDIADLQVRAGEADPDALDRSTHEPELDTEFAPGPDEAESASESPDGGRT